MKVLTYNIQEGGGRRLRDIAAVIHAAQPDAVALLEATRRRKARALARALGMQLVFGTANNAFHVAWLSRQPVLRSQNHRLPGLAKTLLEIEVAWGGAPLRLFATHLSAGSDVLHPAQEAPVIRDLLASLAGAPHVLVGDFNALRPGDPVGPPPPGEEQLGDAIDGDPRLAIRCLLEAGYVDCYRAAHPAAPGYTYPTAHPWLRLDYIFVPPTLAPRLTACELVADEGAVKASDHFPLWAQFE